MDKERASAGHKLGQLVGDWFEEYLALPLLQRVSDHLHLYLDHRFRARKSRIGEKIIWKDVEENGVDYDFVMELGGTSLDSYVDRVRAALGALPQEIRFITQRQSRPAVFETISAATRFLQTPNFDWSHETTNFIYEITYTDGTEFDRTLETIDDVKTLHRQIERLSAHMGRLKR